jgi:tetratricopeptide (TPR) repeat protein
MRFRLAAVFILIFLASEANASWVFSSECRQAYSQIWQYKFPEADAAITAERSKRPDNVIPEYLSNLSQFLRVFATEEGFEQYKKDESDRLDRIDKADQNSPWYYYCRAEINLEGAALRFKFTDYWSGAYQVSKAYNLLESCFSKYPSFLPAQKDLCLLRAAVGTVPGNYRWMLNILGFKGNLKNAMDQYVSMLSAMKTSREYAPFLQESQIIHAYLSNYLLNQPDAAWQEMENATTDYATNPLTAFARANLALRLKKDDIAIETLKTHIAGTPQIPHLDYLYGIARLQKGERDGGYYIARYIKEFKGVHYIKDAYLKLGWAYLLVGDHANYNRSMQMVSYYGNKDLEEDKNALRESQKPKEPSLPLLKARLYYDGGYYTTALEELQKVSVASFKDQDDKAEYYYRSARIEDALEQWDKAIALYNRVMDHYSQSEAYFAPASCLYEGLIWEKKKNFVKAKYYYNKCLTYQSYNYKNSFDQKALAGLKRME